MNEEVIDFRRMVGKGVQYSKFCYENIIYNYIKLVFWQTHSTQLFIELLFRMWYPNKLSLHTNYAIKWFQTNLKFQVKMI